MKPTPLIEITQLAKTYRMGDVDVRALRGVTLTINEGEFVAIMGPSGSGKSTLMHVLGLLDVPDAGSYKLEGQEVSRLNEDEQAALRSRTVGFIFQQFHLLARTSAIDNVALPLQYSGASDSQTYPATLLQKVGLGDRIDHKPNELSGGQQQRVAIARAMVNKPRILFADEPTGNLDSTSEKEIMALLKSLHELGMTVILVTHEEEIGALAQRVIRMRDGVVVSDERRTALGASGALGALGDEIEVVPSAPRAPSAPTAPKRPFSFSSMSTYVRQAWTSLAANKVRSGLSMLGIMIGVASVIAMLALGRGAKEAMEEQLASLGSNLLILQSGSHRSGGVSLQQGAVTRFTVDDGQAILKQIPGVLDINPTVTGRGQAVFGNKNWNTQIVGVTPAYEKLRNYVPAVGRFFTAEEDRMRARVVILGYKPYINLFGQGNAIGAFIKVNRIPFQVIGVFPEKGSSGFRDQDDLVVIPVQTAMRRVLGKTYVDYIDIQTTGAEMMAPVEQAVRDLVIERQRLPPSQQDTFEIRNLADIQAAISASSKIMSLLLSVVAAISLLVGGIGIMNIMLVSVTERTREIGLRKALGARRQDILAQFLIEALTTSVLGGLAGVTLGGMITLGMATFANWTVRITLDSVLIATLFSAGIGLVFGLWPARKAASLNPIEALRFE